MTPFTFFVYTILTLYISPAVVSKVVDISYRYYSGDAVKLLGAPSHEVGVVWALANVKEHMTSFAEVRDEVIGAGLQPVLTLTQQAVERVSAAVSVRVYQASKVLLTSWVCVGVRGSSTTRGHGSSAELGGLVLKLLVLMIRTHRVLRLAVRADVSATGFVGVTYAVVRPVVLGARHLVAPLARELDLSLFAAVFVADVFVTVISTSTKCSNRSRRHSARKMVG